MKIYTKTGDDGTTSLFAGGRVHKYSARIRAYGEIDELNSVLGLARSNDSTNVFSATIVRLQELLFILGADLATPRTASNPIPRIEEGDTKWLESLIDNYETDLEPLSSFILPGGSLLAATLHLARTVSRRAEREIVLLSEQEDIGHLVLPFVNRLSDLFFVMARVANHRLAVTEQKWMGKR